MTGEIILATAALAAGPLTMIAFKLLPSSRKNGDGEVVPKHDHNSRYMPRELCNSKHETMEVMLSNVSRDIREIKDHMSKMDAYVQEAILVERKYMERGGIK